MNGCDYILAIDCGSTNFKGAVFDGLLGRLAECAAPVEYLADRGERVEFDAEAIWRTTVDVVGQACRQAGIKPAQIGTIALTSQAQSFTFLDEKANSLMPFVSWLDTRAVEQAKSLGQEFGDSYHEHSSFAPPVPGQQLPKLMWFRKHEPEQVRQAKTVASLPTFLALRLAGVNAIDRNLTAMNGLYSLARGDWWAEALERAGLTASQLSKLVDMGVPQKTRCPSSEIGLGEHVEIVFAGNDQTAGAFGNCCGEREIIVTLGTALVAYRRLENDAQVHRAGTCWGPYPGGGLYQLAASDHGCASLDWARRQLLPESGVQEFVELAESAATLGVPVEKDELTDKAFFYPALRSSKKAWVGSPNDSERALAVFEGISFSLREMIVGELGCEGDSHELCAIGGGSESDFWLQLLADLMGCAIRRGTGDSLLGAAMMARPNVTVPFARATRSSAKTDSFVPDKSRVTRYRDQYNQWAARAAEQDNTGDV